MFRGWGRKDRGIEIMSAFSNKPKNYGIIIITLSFSVHEVLALVLPSSWILPRFCWKLIVWTAELKFNKDFWFCVPILRPFFASFLYLQFHSESKFSRQQNYTGVVKHSRIHICVLVGIRSSQYEQNCREWGLSEKPSPKLFGQSLWRAPLPPTPKR